MFSSLKKMFGGKEDKKAVLAPASGKAVSLKEVNDPTFSQEILGKGVAIIPSEGKIVAPADGTISVFFETKHAVSISAENGAEIIVHVGLDTVNLKGEHFIAHKQQGDKVKAGELLLEFDMEAIKAAGYDVITPVIICNTPDFPDMVCHTGQEVQALDTIIEL